MSPRSGKDQRPSSQRKGSRKASKNGVAKSRSTPSSSATPTKHASTPKNPSGRPILATVERSGRVQRPGPLDPSSTDLPIERFTVAGARNDNDDTMSSPSRRTLGTPMQSKPSGSRPSPTTLRTRAKTTLPTRTLVVDLSPTLHRGNDSSPGVSMDNAILVSSSPPPGQFSRRQPIVLPPPPPADTAGDAFGSPDYSSGFGGNESDEYPSKKPDPTPWTGHNGASSSVSKRRHAPEFPQESRNASQEHGNPTRRSALPIEAKPRAIKSGTSSRKRQFELGEDNAVDEDARDDDTGTADDNQKDLPRRPDFDSSSSEHKKLRRSVEGKGLDKDQPTRSPQELNRRNQIGLDKVSHETTTAKLESSLVVNLNSSFVSADGISATSPRADENGDSDSEDFVSQSLQRAQSWVRNGKVNGDRLRESKRASEMPSARSVVHPPSGQKRNNHKPGTHPLGVVQGSSHGNPVDDAGGEGAYMTPAATAPGQSQRAQATYTPQSSPRSLSSDRSHQSSSSPLRQDVKEEELDDEAMASLPGPTSFRRNPEIIPDLNAESGSEEDEPLEGLDADFELEIGSRSSSCDSGDSEDSENGSTEVSREEVIKFIYEDLARESGFGGCSEAEHSALEERHDQHDCHDLSATYDTGTEDLRVGIPLFSTHLPRPFKHGMLMNEKDVAARRYYMEGEQRPTAPATRRRLSEPEQPIAHDNTPPTLKHVCMQKASRPADDTRAWVGFDVDSFMFIPKSPAVFGCMEWQTARSRNEMVRTDLHFNVVCKFRNGNGKYVNQAKKMHQIPHIFLGSANIPSRAQVFVFFPRLVRDDRHRFNYLTEADEVTFVDKVWYPSLDMRSHQSQHVPSSSDLAESMASAKSREGLGNANYKTRPTFSLQKENLLGVEARMQDIIQSQQSYAKFKDCFIFVTAKNTKLAHKNSNSLAEGMSNWYTKFKMGVDMEFIDKDKMWVDVGKEICAFGKNEDADASPHTYLHRACCLQRVARHYEEHLFKTGPGRVNYYHTGSLQEVVDMTILTPRLSQAHRHGLYYSQWYGSTKEPFDSQQTYPFDNKALLHMSIDQRAWEANVNARRSATGGSVSKYERIEKAYVAAKKRAKEACVGNSEKCYGVRKEHRMTCRLFEGILEYAQLAEDEQSEGDLDENEFSRPGLSLIRAPTFVWSVPTANWMTFIHGNWHKLTGAFEMGLRTAEHRDINLEQTRVLYMVLKNLQLFFNANWNATPILSENIRQGPNCRRGMGMSGNMKKYGFGWWLPHVNWAAHELKPGIRLNFPKINDVLSRMISESGAARVVQRTHRFGMYKRMYSDLKTHRWAIYGSRGRRILLNLICHLCMSHFRLYYKKFFLDKKDLSAKSDATIDDLSFSYRTWAELRRGVHIPDPKHGHHCLATPKVGRLEHLFHTWWGVDGDGAEKCRPTTRVEFRNLWIDALEWIDREGGRSQRKELESTMRREFWKFHYVVPAPSRRNFVTNKKVNEGHQRIFWAIDPPQKAILLGEHDNRWQPCLSEFVDPDRAPPWPPVQTKYEYDELWHYITSRTSMTLRWMGAVGPMGLPMGEVEGTMVGRDGYDSDGQSDTADGDSLDNPVVVD